jgi:aldose 1-epimerase
MVPYANRIAGGKFDFGNQSVQLRPNWDLDPHPLHGEGWRGAWRVVQSAGASAVIAFEGGGGEWPWRYRAEQSFQTVGDTLTVQLSVTNLSQSSMPTVLGLHPFFGDATHATVVAHAPRVWLTDPECLPVREVETPALWSFEHGRQISDVVLDHCFTGWNSQATVIWPDRQVQIKATHCDCLHIYAPAGQSFFCLEPQSGPVGVLHRNSNEASVVQAGRKHEVEVQFTVG